MSHPYGPGPQYPQGFHDGQQPQFGYPQPGAGLCLTALGGGALMPFSFVGLIEFS